MRTVNDPQGGNASLVDKMIGNAYEVVKHVAMNMKYIRHVSNNLEAIFKVAGQLDALQPQVKLSGLAASLGAATTIPLGIPANTVSAVNVQVTASDGAIYFPSPVTFTFVIRDGGLVITTSVSAPATLVGGSVTALISYTPAA